MNTVLVHLCLSENTCIRQKKKLFLFTTWHTGGSKGTAPLILSLGTRRRWVVNLAFPTSFFRGNEPQYPKNKRLGRPRGRFCLFAGHKIFSSAEIRTPDGPAHILVTVPTVLPWLRCTTAEQNTENKKCPWKEICGYNMQVTQLDVGRLGEWHCSPPSKHRQ
jgi:hypothetical protein